MQLGSRDHLLKVPRHIGVIPDGNRRWAEAKGLPRARGYAAGVNPGLRMLDLCRQLGVEEVTAYGFTRENVKRPAAQVHAFRDACVTLAVEAVDAGAALLVVGEHRSSVFPDELRLFTGSRAPGDIRFNLLINYNWQWDLACAASALSTQAGAGAPDIQRHLGSRDVSRLDLVVRWGGRRRLSGFVPLQCAYADICVLDTLSPDMSEEELEGALRWYARQEVTLGG